MTEMSVQDRRLKTLSRIRVSKRMFRGTVADILGYFLALTKYAEWTVDGDRAMALLAKQPPGLLGMRSGEISVNPKAFGPWVRRNASRLMKSPDRLTEELRREYLLTGYSWEESQEPHFAQFWDGDGNVRDAIYTSVFDIHLPLSVLKKLWKHDPPVRDFLDLTGLTRDELTTICGDDQTVEKLARALASCELDLKGEEGSWHAAMMQRVDEAYNDELQIDLEEDLADRSGPATEYLREHRAMAPSADAMYRAADAARDADQTSGDVMAVAIPHVVVGGTAADEVDEPLDSDTDECGSEPNILDERVDSEATGFSSRIFNPLIAAGITHVEQLIGRSEQELLNIPKVGPHAIIRIRQFLREHDLHLKDDPEVSWMT